MSIRDVAELRIDRALYYAFGLMAPYILGAKHRALVTLGTRRRVIADGLTDAEADR